MPIEPDEQQLRGIAARIAAGDERPYVMLNLNRYRDRDAYLRYGTVAMQIIERVGGKILWQADTPFNAIGDGSDDYDEVIAVWYPNLRAFVELATDPELVVAAQHRRDALERAAVICCVSGPEPALGVGLDV